MILTTKGIDDMCLKLFVEAGAMAVRRCKKEDLRRIAKATGATLISTLANLEGEETYDASYLGEAEEVVQDRISDDECILVKGTKVQSSASIILRGANDYMLDEMERSLHDALCVVKRTLESGSVVPGGGAVETALNIHLENFATTLVRLLLRVNSLTMWYANVSNVLTLYSFTFFLCRVLVSNWPFSSLQTRFLSSPRRWLSMLQRTLRTWSPHFVFTTTVLRTTPRSRH